MAAAPTPPGASQADLGFEPLGFWFRVGFRVKRCRCSGAEQISAVACSGAPLPGGQLALFYIILGPRPRAPPNRDYRVPDGNIRWGRSRIMIVAAGLLFVVMLRSHHQSYKPSCWCSAIMFIILPRAGI